MGRWWEGNSTTPPPKLPVPHRNTLLLVFITLLSSVNAVVHLVNADEVLGGILIDTSSLNATGSGEVGEGNFSLNMTINEVEGGNATGVVHLVVQDLDGEEVVAINYPLNLSSNESINLSLSIGPVEPGIYLLLTYLEGDLATPGQYKGVSHEATWSTTVQRLSPATPYLVPSQQWSLGIIDGNGSASGNNSLRSGDFLEIEFTIRNLGDLAWNGSWEAQFSVGGEPATHLNEGEVNLSGGNAQSVNLTTPQLTEGISMLIVNLSHHNGSGVENGVGELHLEVGPPPLPEISVGISPSIPQPSLGDEVDWNLTIYNSGEIEWIGEVGCTFPGPHINLLTQNIELESNSSLTIGFNLTARPGTLDCEAHSQMRIHTTSITKVNHTWEMAAAEFVSAGDEGAILLGAQFHVGDKATLSILVHNEGDLAGSATLAVHYGGEWIQGTAIDIEAGHSAELVVDWTITTEGDFSHNWTVMSENGLVDSRLGGSISSYVLSSQNLTMAPTISDWDIVDGIQLDIPISLSQGKGRRIEVSVFAQETDSETNLHSQIVEIEPGLRTLELSLHPPSETQEILVALIPIGWVPSEAPESLLHLTKPLIAPEISVTSTTSTKTGFTLHYILKNTNGTSHTPTGTLYLWGDSELLGQSSTPRVAPSEEFKGDIEIQKWTVDAGRDLNLEIKWNCGEVIDSDSTTIQRPGGMVADIPIDIPFLKLFGGIAAGVAIAIIARKWIRREKLTLEEKKERDAKRESERTKRLISSHTPASPKDGEAGKREVECDLCGQKLRVPIDYSGLAGCPACKNRFKVVPVITKPKPESAEVVDEEEDKTHEAASLTNVIACPGCESKLSVPLDKRPVTARCPACRLEFLAIEG